jgi:hypothetical protein
MGDWCTALGQTDFAWEMMMALESYLHIRWRRNLSFDYVLMTAFATFPTFLLS